MDDHETSLDSSSYIMLPICWNSYCLKNDRESWASSTNTWETDGLCWSDQSLEVLAGSCPDQYFSVDSLDAPTNFYAFFF